MVSILSGFERSGCCMRTPCRSLISLLLTIRLGCTTSSFISEIKSVPPASTAASSQLVPSSPMACSLVVALAYSNARIFSASFLFQRRQNLVRGQRQRRHAHADGVGDGVRDSRARRNHRRLAQPDDAALVVALAGHHMNLEVADVANPRELIKLHVGVQHPTELLIHDLLFVKRVTNTHDQRAVD